MGKGDAPKRENVDAEAIAGNTRSAKRDRGDKEFHEMGKGEHTDQQKQKRRKVEKLTDEARHQQEKQIAKAKASGTINDQSTLQLMLNQTAEMAMNSGDTSSIVDAKSENSASHDVVERTVTPEEIFSRTETFMKEHRSCKRYIEQEFPKLTNAQNDKEALKVLENCKEALETYKGEATKHSEELKSISSEELKSISLEGNNPRFSKVLSDYMQELSKVDGTVTGVINNLQEFILSEVTNCGLKGLKVVG